MIRISISIITHHSVLNQWLVDLFKLASGTVNGVQSDQVTIVSGASQTTGKRAAENTGPTLDAKVTPNEKTTIQYSVTLPQQNRLYRSALFYIMLRM